MSDIKMGQKKNPIQWTGQKHTERRRDWQKSKETNRKAERLAERQRDWKKGRETGRKAEIQK